MSSTPREWTTERHQDEYVGSAPVTPSGADRAPLDEAEVRARNESLGEMFSSFTEHLSTLFRQEVQLAKAEATSSAKQAGNAAAMFAAAAVGAVFLLMFLSLALMWALGEAMHLGWAALVVAVIWAIAAAVLALVGKQRAARITALPQTKETVQEIPATLNPSKETP